MKSKRKGFGIDFPSVVMGLDRIQNSPWKRLQKCYRTNFSFGKAQPKQQVCETTRDTYHCHLNRYPSHFSEGQVQHKGGFPGDPMGIARGE
jgi:hypothetical protein